MDGVGCVYFRHPSLVEPISLAIRESKRLESSLAGEIFFWLIELPAGECKSCNAHCAFHCLARQIQRASFCRLRELFCNIAINIINAAARHNRASMAKTGVFSDIKIKMMVNGKEV
jgi:hypothetical protein